MLGAAEFYRVSGGSFASFMKSLSDVRMLKSAPLFCTFVLDDEGLLLWIRALES